MEYIGRKDRLFTYAVDVVGNRVTGKYRVLIGKGKTDRTGVLLVPLLSIFPI